MLKAFREICNEEGFDELLEATLTRISAIESLGRTREITIKDLWNKGKYHIKSLDGKGNVEKTLQMEVDPSRNEIGQFEDDDEDKGDDDGGKSKEGGKE